MGEPSRRQEVRTRKSLGLCSPEPWSKSGMDPAEGHDIQQTSNGTAGSEAYLFCTSDKKRGQVLLSTLSLGSLIVASSPTGSSEVLRKYM